MKFIRLSLVLLSFLAVLGLWSCGGSKEEQTQNSDEFAEAEGSVKENIEELVYNIPSPSEIPYLLQRTGAEFNQSLLNDRKKADSYGTRPDKAALNLGIYTTDIGYLSSYDKTQEAIDYLNASKKLADNLGVIGTFDTEVLKSFESNIGNKDSLASILNRAVKSTDKYLKDDSKNRLAALLLTGSFIEGLYISTELIKTYPKDILPNDARNLILTPLIQVILNQEKSVDEMAKMLGSLKDQAEPIASLNTDIVALQASYRALNIEEQLKNNRSDLVLTDQHLTEITSIVEKIRKSIVD
jgi:hypothetical protein